MIVSAENFLNKNLEYIEAAYFDKYGGFTGMPNPRVEAVGDDGTMIISCHYDNYDDYHDDCGDANHHGAINCEVCHMKDSWDFQLRLNSEFPGGFCVV